MPGPLQKVLVALLLFAVVAVDFTSKIMSIAFDAAFILGVLFVLRTWFWETDKS